MSTTSAQPGNLGASSRPIAAPLERRAELLGIDLAMVIGGTANGSAEPPWVIAVGRAQSFALRPEHAAVDAKIEPPEHWVDPKHDTGPTRWDDPPSSL